MYIYSQDLCFEVAWTKIIGFCIVQRGFCWLSGDLHLSSLAFSVPFRYFYFSFCAAANSTALLFFFSFFISVETLSYFHCFLISAITSLFNFPFIFFFVYQTL